MERIPFPEFLRKFLRSVTKRAGRIHLLAPIAVALVFAYVAAEITLWLARQPLFYLWQVFGWVAARDASRLIYYNIFAHIVAFVVGWKVVAEMRPIGGGDD